MSDACINGRAKCHIQELHHHSGGELNVEDEVRDAFAALRAQLAEVTRELEQARAEINGLRGASSRCDRCGAESDKTSASYC